MLEIQIENLVENDGEKVIYGVGVLPDAVYDIGNGRGTTDDKDRYQKRKFRRSTYRGSLRRRRYC